MNPNTTPEHEVSGAMRAMQLATIFVVGSFILESENIPVIAAPVAAAKFIYNL